jgi:hypothetical protein
MKEYFSHDYNARHDRKITALVKEYKSSGYGIFWATCELMHEEGDRLDYDEITFGAIAKDLNESEEFVEEVIDKCISKFKLFAKQESKLTSSRVKQNLSGREAKRSKKQAAGKLGGIKSGESRRSKQNEAPLEANELKESKLKESKLKESKLKESKLKESINNGGLEKFILKMHGLGEMEVSVLNNCEQWQLTEIKNFITSSQQNFESIAMNTPLMNNCQNFKIVIQEFVNMIQATNDYQESSQLRRFFGNWVSKKNGSLESFISNIKGNSSGKKNLNHIV